MNENRYKWILYVIVSVIVATIVIQVYWNYKNYLNNKQQLVIDVQACLDKSVDDYYTRLAERTTLGIFLEGDQQKNALAEGSKVDKLIKSIDTLRNEFKDLDSVDFSNIEGIKVFKGLRVDSMSQIHDALHPTTSTANFKKRIDSFKTTNVKFDVDNLDLLTSKIVISINNDSLDIKEVDSLLTQEFKRKQIGLESTLSFYKSDVMRQVAKIKDSISIQNKIDNTYSLSAVSKSTFLPKGSILELKYSNETFTVLKRSISGVFISSLLILAVISCLFYLLKIIKHQKQLAEVKNDLISNITHEFKTPIATISVALESINNFNGIDDKEKTKNYINMSSQQLNKLNLMVEKLLETATLDSDNLELKKEAVDIVNLLHTVINRYIIQFPEKEFQYSFKLESVMINIDVFHIENAINNILDNAVKYGGSIISINVILKDKSLDISISDNGNTLSKINKDRIFEKFYRVPKGNTHDIKGFGIGLYYTRTIIEKHNGFVNLELNKNLTTFKISLPYG